MTDHQVAWNRLAEVVRRALPDGTWRPLLDAVDDEQGRSTIALAEALVADIGRWLVARGLGDVWADLFRHLASDAGGAFGPRDNPVPGDELRFLERAGRTDGCSRG